MKKLFLAFVAISAMVLSACNSGSDKAAQNGDPELRKQFVGKWVTPLDSTTDTGFGLNEDGSAYPINSVFMFKSWNVFSDTLVLTVMAQDPQDSTKTIESTTPWIVKSVTPDSMIITFDGINNLVYYHK